MRILLVMVLLLGLGSCEPIVSTDQVRFESGAVQGIVVEDVNAFLGIPYATPPVGEYRWQVPKRPLKWGTTLRADTPPPHCFQSMFGYTRGQEDCLYLNVWTPKIKAKKDERLPVMVWFHGGGFTVGHSYETTPGHRLAKHGNVVVVSVNYRLGALGFMAHPELSSQSNYKTSGNYGMLDQVHALKWVQKNIHAFGGDRQNITIFGESAGGMSVCNHLVSPFSARRFKQAIIQSGPCFTPYPSLETMEHQGVEVSKRLGCEETEDVAACLREKSPEEVMSVMPPDPGMAFGEEEGIWMPNVDGMFLKEQPLTSFTEGRINPASVINGNNANEGELIVMFGHEYRFRKVTEENYIDKIDYLIRDKEKSKLVAEKYPLENYDDPGAALSAVFSDHTFVCHEKFTSDAMAKHFPVYSYYFTYPDADFILPELRELGAFHSAELQFLFHDPMAWFESTFSGDELKLSNTIMDYWTRFAHTGNPNGEGSFQWPEYNTERQRLQLDVEPGVVSASASDEICQFWDGIMNKEFVQ